MPDAVTHALDHIIDGLVSHRGTPCFPGTNDPDWRSPCEDDCPPDSWRPVPQAPIMDFSGLEHALELTLHPDVVSYYSHLWSGTLDLEAHEGEVHLIQLWSPRDFDRLIENLIGHSLNKRSSKTGYTTFFATTEPDAEHFLSVDNQTGAVVLEKPRGPPLQTVAPDLAGFLMRLHPPTA